MELLRHQARTPVAPWNGPGAPHGAAEAAQEVGSGEAAEGRSERRRNEDKMKIS